MHCRELTLAHDRLSNRKQTASYTTRFLVAELDVMSEVTENDAALLPSATPSV